MVGSKMETWFLLLI